MVEGCFTCGAVGGQGVRVHMCVRDRMRKTKIETSFEMVEYMRNIKDLNLNKRGHESGRGDRRGRWE